MPFISKDWRSPGEEWVRYEGGWELKKTILVNNFQKDQKEGCEDHGAEIQDDSPSLDADVCNFSSPSVRPKKQKQISEPSEEEETVEDYLRRHRLNLQPQQAQMMNLNNNNNDNNLNIQNDNLINIDNNEDRKRRYSGTILLRLDRRTQPYCPITLKNTREVAGFNELAEAMLRLDMIQAVKDIRRFNYVSKLMYLLFSHDKLSQLPGAAQKILFRMLEEMADTVYKTNQNQHVLQKLMEELQTTMTIYHVWGSHLGSSNLFKQHVESRRKITEFVERMQVEFKQDLATPGLVASLPEECIREILLRLSDSKDVECAGRACLTMNNIAREKRVWRELVQTNFSKQQVEYILQNRPGLRENRDWKHLYQSLRRRYGLREDFTEVVMLCRKCCALYWQSLGHPCFIPVDQLLAEHEENSGKIWNQAAFNLIEGPEKVESGNGGGSNEWSIPLTPVAFLSFFSI